MSIKMKSQITFLVFIISLVSSQFCFGQKKKAILIDEIPKTNCDDLSAHLDNFLLEIGNKPTSKGYVVIYGDKNQPIQKYVYENMLKEFVKFYKFDESLISYLHGKDESDLRTQFWIASDNADKPIFDEQEWNYVLDQNVKPTIVHADSWVGELCPTTFSIEFYSKLLLANPNLRGKIIIYQSSTKSFRKTERDLKNQLLNKYKISRKQLEFVYKKRKSFDVEYWITPQVQK